MIRAGFVLCVVLLLCGTADARRKKSIESPPAEAATSSAPSDGQQAAATPAAPAAPAAPAPHTGVTQSPPVPSPDELPKKPITKAEIDATLAEAASMFKAGQHVEAADKLMLVYESDPQPLLLFNAGQAYRRAKRPKQAKEAYQTFLSVAPTHSLCPEVRGYVRDMDTLLELQQREQQISLQLQQEKDVANSAQQALEQERSKPVYKRPLFWGLIAGLGVAVIAGVTAAAVIGVRVQADIRADIQK